MSAVTHGASITISDLAHIRPFGSLMPGLDGGGAVGVRRASTVKSDPYTKNRQSSPPARVRRELGRAGSAPGFFHKRHCAARAGEQVHASRPGDLLKRPGPGDGGPPPAEAGTTRPRRRAGETFEGSNLVSRGKRRPDRSRPKRAGLLATCRRQQSVDDR